MTPVRERMANRTGTMRDGAGSRRKGEDADGAVKSGASSANSRGLFRGSRSARAAETWSCADVALKQRRNSCAMSSEERRDVTSRAWAAPHTLVLVVAHSRGARAYPPGDRPHTEGLKARKEQLLRTAYLTAARSDADVVNHLARRIVEGQGKLAGAQAAAAPKK